MITLSFRNNISTFRLSQKRTFFSSLKRSNERDERLKEKFEQLKGRKHDIKPPHGTQVVRQAIPGVKYTVAVASGKGGVGKSTCAVNLALAFEKMNLKTGLLDTDVYGPSLPIMMNLKGHRAFVDEDKKLIPLKNYNISCMSVGFMIPEEKALIWRGLMVMSAVQQMLRQVAWGELDILVMDLPPGTGDTQLTLTQTVPLSGAVIISTPQDLALSDAIRGINMFQTVNVPILGIVENMSYFTCSSCGHKDHIFGDSGAEKMSRDMKIDFLGKIPLNTTIRSTTDAGKPIVVSDPESENSKTFIEMASKIYKKLEFQNDKSDNK